MPVACKKPGARLTGEMGSRAEEPAVLQEKAILLGKFFEGGFRGIHQASPESIMPLFIKCVPVNSCPENF
jgi:hypothetical protein